MSGIACPLDHQRSTAVLKAVAVDRCNNPNSARRAWIELHRCLLATEQMASAVKHQAALLLRSLVATNRTRPTASQIASASVASFFCRASSAFGG
jgi:hypothetical protein